MHNENGVYLFSKFELLLLKTNGLITNRWIWKWLLLGTTLG
jgi:hypothetical protein